MNYKIYKAHVFYHVVLFPVILANFYLLSRAFSTESAIPRVLSTRATGGDAALAVRV